MTTERIGQYEIHPAAAVLPIMSDQELAELAADIKKNGQRHAIVLHQDKVIDGRNRLLACTKAGVPPLVAAWDGKGSVVDFIVSENVARRHLTPSQKAAVALELRPFFEDEAHVRQVAPLKKGGKAPLPPVGGNEKQGRAAAAAAEAVGASQRSVERAATIAKRAPEVLPEVRDGAISLGKAEEISKLPAERRPEAIERAKKNPRAAMNVETEDDNDVRFTPRALIEQLHREHRFTVDAASDPKSPAAQVIGRHWTREDDGLEESWRGERVWINPPFSAIPDWVAKAHREAPSVQRIVMLLPATRTEQPFWQEFIEPYRDGRKDRDGVAMITRFLPARTRFGSPADPEGAASGSPPFGCVLVTWSSLEDGSSEDPKIPTGSRPPVDDGTLCGVYDGKRGDPCIHKQGHEGHHSNGRRTWANKPPKAKREAKDEPDPAKRARAAPDRLWRGGVARNAKVHCYIMSRRDVGLCGAGLGDAKAERAGGTICAVCVELAGAPFFKQSLEAYRDGKDLCPWCGVTRKENNPEKGGPGWISSGMLDGRYGLSNCGTCLTKGKPRHYVGEERRNEWMAATVGRTPKNTKGRKSKGAKRNG